MFDCPNILVFHSKIPMYHVHGKGEGVSYPDSEFNTKKKCPDIQRKKIVNSIY